MLEPNAAIAGTGLMGAGAWSPGGGAGEEDMVGGGEPPIPLCSIAPKELGAAMMPDWGSTMGSLASMHCKAFFSPFSVLPSCLNTILFASEAPLENLGA